MCHITHVSMFFSFSLAFISVSGVSVYLCLFALLSTPLSSCLCLPLLSLSLASPSLPVLLSLSHLICVSPYQLKSAMQNQNKPWLVGFGRCTVRLKTERAFFSLPEIFPSAKPQNNTGIFLFLNYSTVLNLIPSHALNIALLAMHACILSYKIVFSALWFF